MPTYWVLAVVAAAGCVSSHAVVCEDGRVCPEGTVCDVAHGACTTQEAVAQCSGMPDRTACTLPDGPGTCHEGVCLAASCGNARLDLTNEVCDDGNATDGDGCAADCASTERCGNAIIDLIRGETCDDNGQLQHDGCSSVCTAEVPHWTQSGRVAGARGRAFATLDSARGRIVMHGGVGPAGTWTDTLEWSGTWHPVPNELPPPSRSEATVAYDHRRRRTVLIGGVVEGLSSREVWEWDGAAWTRGIDTPVALADGGATYDARRERIVVAGGVTAGTSASGWIPLTDTYEYDGVTWTKVTTPATPPPREFPAMTFDPKRGVVVMFGGRAPGGSGPPYTVRDDLWEYDGISWTQRSASGAPTGRWDTRMAFDTKNQRVVVLGGFDADEAAVPGMWSWNGSTWASFGGTLPPARGGHVLVQDGHGRLVVYGGQDSGNTITTSYLSDLWYFDGTAWTQETAPSARWLSASANDPERGTVVLVGGSNGGIDLDDVWELSPRGWTSDTGTRPPAQEGAAMAYDLARHQLVMFGGVKYIPGPVTPNTKTWLRTGTQWTAVEPTPSPPPRFRPALAYDAARNETVLFGGSYTSDYADTWVWNGSTWTERSPANSPPAGAHAIGYDAVHERVVLLAAATTDTYVWDGQDWTVVTITERPRRASHSRLVWHPALRQLLLVGGGSGVFETWALTLTEVSPPNGTWSRIGVVSRPPATEMPVAYPLLDGSGVAIFGGYSPTGLGLYDTTWELAYAGARPSDACGVAIDLDGDGLAGCADLDCWPVCSPTCPPGASCPAAAVRCGDGTCGAVESCVTCPADCSCTSTCGDFVCDPGEACPGDC